MSERRSPHDGINPGMSDLSVLDKEVFDAFNLWYDLRYPYGHSNSQHRGDCREAFIAAISWIMSAS